MTDRTRRVAALLLAVCVVLAGCNGVFGGESGDGPPTFTPAAVPTDEPTPTPAPRLAPGLTGGRVVNASALAAAHEAALENTSFTMQGTAVYRTRNGTSVRRVTSVTRVGADGRFRITKRWNGTTALERVAYYDDGERLLVATTTSDATTYRRASPGTVGSDGSSVAGTGSEQLERVLTIAETRVVGRAERNGTTVYRLVPDRGNRSGEGADLSRSVEVRARVTSRGLVRSYAFRQTLSGEEADGTAVIVVSTRYTEVGSTDVERPAWYGTAIAATNAMAANRTDTDATTVAG